MSTPLLVSVASVAQKDTACSSRTISRMPGMRPSAAMNRLLPVRLRDASSAASSTNRDAAREQRRVLADEPRQVEDELRGTLQLGLEAGQRALEFRDDGDQHEDQNADRRHDEDRWIGDRRADATAEVLAAPPLMRHHLQGLVERAGDFRHLHHLHIGARKDIRVAGDRFRQAVAAGDAVMQFPHQLGGGRPCAGIRENQQSAGRASRPP